MKLFLYALMITLGVVGCESYHREDEGAIQEQQEIIEKLTKRIEELERR